MTHLPFFARENVTRKDLAALFAELGFTEGLEVGTYLAEFACQLLSLNPKLHLTCVDPWMAYDNITQEREEKFYALAMRRLRGQNVTVIRKTSMEAVRDIKDKSLDFLHIDGNHAFDYVMPDLICWVPKVKPGGIILAHDYDAYFGTDVQMAVHAYTQAHHIDPWYITREIPMTAYWVQK
jgi:predicted O-methyltransferase YrrM